MATARKGGEGLNKKVQPSPELSEIVGPEPISRSEVMKKVWDYIKARDLQDPENKRNIRADDKLRPLFGADKVSMFEMTALISKHLK